MRFWFAVIAIVMLAMLAPLQSGAARQITLVPDQCVQATHGAAIKIMIETDVPLKKICFKVVGGPMTCGSMLFANDGAFSCAYGSSLPDGFLGGTVFSGSSGSGFAGTLWLNFMMPGEATITLSDIVGTRADGTTVTDFGVNTINQVVVPHTPEEVEVVYVSGADDYGALVLERKDRARAYVIRSIGCFMNEGVISQLRACNGSAIISGHSTPYHHSMLSPNEFEIESIRAVPGDPLKPVLITGKAIHNGTSNKGLNPFGMLVKVVGRAHIYHLEASPGHIYHYLFVDDGSTPDNPTITYEFKPLITRGILIDSSDRRDFSEIQEGSLLECVGTVTHEKSIPKLFVYHWDMNETNPITKFGWRVIDP